MSAYAAPAPNAYRESAVLTASPERLVVLLYDGARRFLTQASVAMAEGRHDVASDRLGRAEAIIDELLETLDLSAGEVSERLQGLYLFFRRHLFEARMHQDSERAEAVNRLMGELRDAWAEVAGA
ncbi:MAG: flagellar export chaperone FliS [Solirubrobacteraceae bacterium]|nr:flagellar export chaperone FliS [Solirubrobacteraceae bacterium]